MQAGGNTNICQRVTFSQISGKGIRHVKEIPMSCFGKEKEIITEERLHLLYELSSWHHLKAGKKTSWLPVLLRQLMKLEQSISKSAGVVSTTVASMFCAFGLVEDLLDILVMNVFNVEEMIFSTDQTSLSDEGITCPRDNLDDADVLVSTVRACMQHSPMDFHHLRWRYKLLEVLFSLMSESASKIYVEVSSIMEDIFSASECAPIRLREVDGLYSLIDRVSEAEMQTCFDHTMSNFISDWDFTAATPTTLEKLDQYLAKNCFCVVDDNQDFLLQHPTFFKRICDQASREFIKDSRSRELIIGMLLHGLNLSGANFQSMFERHFETTEGEMLIRDMTLYKEKSSRAHLFHIIALMLTGKHREEVQNRLVNYGFITKLHEVAEDIVWKDLSDDVISAITGGHSPSEIEDCNPDIFIRIQYLRLIHSVADNHRNRYRLLSQTELEELKREAASTNIELPDEIATIKPSELIQSSSGLLSRIVDRLVAEPFTSLVRFWITRAMEAFLRGKPNPIHQSFLLKKNLIEDSVELLIAFEPTNEMITQGVFDFLSAVMKFNAEAFERFDRVLECSAHFMLVICRMEKNFVDSNMFIRCIVLTGRYFREKEIVDVCEKFDELPGSSTQYKPTLHNRLIKYFMRTEQLNSVVANLVRLITVPTLSQENISCLNTCLLILYFFHQDQCLESSLQSLMELEDGKYVLRNLLELLKFWVVHYTIYDKKMDRFNLESSTGIDFKDWLQLAHLLLSDDGDSPLSIQHYLNLLCSPAHVDWSTVTCGETLC